MASTITLPPEVLEQFQKLHQMAHKEGKEKRLAIVASKGTLDMAYPVLILATTAAAMGWEVGVFFTFYGLDIINKKKTGRLKVAPIANPAAPIPVPNILGVIPGMTFLATKVLKRFMGRANMPPLEQLLDLSRRLEVKLIGCSTTMGVMRVKAEDLLDGVEIQGAAAFLDFASEASVTLFI